MDNIEDLLRHAMQTLAEGHKKAAADLGINVADGYPKWNSGGNAVKGPRQEFYFRIGDKATSVESIGTDELIAYAKGDRAAHNIKLNALMKHLCGHPTTDKRSS
jgi:hypothetical protein